MHLSYSEDILQRIRAQQSLHNTMNNFITPHNNPESTFQSTMFKSKNFGFHNTSRLVQTGLSPLSKRPISYNECISEEESKVRGRYRLRNFRQPKLNIGKTDSRKLNEEKWKSVSYNGLKELMRTEIEKGSVKRNYEKIIENGEFDVVEKLKS